MQERYFIGTMYGLADTAKHIELQHHHLCPHSSSSGIVCWSAGRKWVVRQGHAAHGYIGGGRAKGKDWLHLYVSTYLLSRRQVNPDRDEGSSPSGNRPGPGAQARGHHVDHRIEGGLRTWGGIHTCHIHRGSHHHRPGSCHRPCRHRTLLLLLRGTRVQSVQVVRNGSSRPRRRP